MAEIDKSLPNVEQTINVPSPEEIEEAALEEQQEVAEQGGGNSLRGPPGSPEKPTEWRPSPKLTSRAKP